VPLLLRLDDSLKNMKSLRFPAGNQLLCEGFSGHPVNDRAKGGTNRRRITSQADFPFCSPQHVVPGEPAAG
jgi:hypothetical protein